MNPARISPFPRPHVCTIRNRSAGAVGSEKGTHALGKRMIYQWLARQEEVLLETVKVEKTLSTNPDNKPDIQALLAQGLEMVFEVQRSHLYDRDWHGRRIEGYADAGIRDVWLWTPDTVPSGYKVGNLTDMLVIDPCSNLLGLPAILSSAEEVQHVKEGLILRKEMPYIHPLLAHGSRATHAVCAPIDEWKLSVDGTMIPPKSISSIVDYGQVVHRLKDPLDQRQFAFGLGNSRAAQGLGWSSLIEIARGRGIVEMKRGSSCVRLDGGIVLVDRTDGFSREEFEDEHPKFVSAGFKDVWVVDARHPIDLKLRRDHHRNFLVMLHPEMRTPHAIIMGRKHSLANGLEHVITGRLDHSQALVFSDYDMYPAQNSHFMKLYKSRKPTAV